MLIQKKKKKVIHLPLSSLREEVCRDGHSAENRIWAATFSLFMSGRGKLLCREMCRGKREWPQREGSQ